MGLALNEIDREARAIEFYGVLSSFDFISSTPTLFNAGTLRPQLSSCYLTTVPDALDGNLTVRSATTRCSRNRPAGLGNDWTRVRALGAHIKGTNGKSQGIVPFLKVANDTAVAVNQGGKRKGAVCAYLETWHLDVEEFLELRKNTGDERRRTHDMHTANWIPGPLHAARRGRRGVDAVLARMRRPTCTTSTGARSSSAYERHEQRADARRGADCSRRSARSSCGARCCRCSSRRGIRGSRSRTPATCARRSSTRASCTARTSAPRSRSILRTTEIAVCNLGSVNLADHVTERGLDLERLGRTVRTALRMLDNVIDINWYSVPQARRSNLKHRPVGLGLMGFQDALYALRIPYASATPPSSSRIARWRRSRTSRSRHRPISRRSAGAIRASTGRSGSAASCRSTRSSCSTRSAAASSTSTAAARSIGTPLRERVRTSGMRN